MDEARTFVYEALYSLQLLEPIYDTLSSLRLYRFFEAGGGFGDRSRDLPKRFIGLTRRVDAEYSAKSGRSRA